MGFVPTLFEKTQGRLVLFKLSQTAFDLIGGQKWPTAWSGDPGKFACSLLKIPLTVEKTIASVASIRTALSTSPNRTPNQRLILVHRVLGCIKIFFSLLKKCVIRPLHLSGEAMLSPSFTGRTLQALKLITLFRYCLKAVHGVFTLALSLKQRFSAAVKLVLTLSKLGYQALQFSAFQAPPLIKGILNLAMIFLKLIIIGLENSKGLPKIERFC